LKLLLTLQKRQLLKASNEQIFKEIIMSFYWDEDKMRNAGHLAPSILAIGDSWFWYPFPGGNLINNLGPMVGRKSHVILAKGNNGADVSDYTVGKYKGIVREALRKYGKSLSAVLISGGGNDFAGLHDLRPLLKNDCSGESNAKDCFKTGAGGLNEFMASIDNHYRNLIGQIYTRTPANCHIIMHTYDYAIPDGKGVFGSKGWLRPALVEAQVPAALHQACMDHVLDSFAKTLTSITKSDPTHFHVVDSRGVLKASDWANELHPKGSGFAKIAEKSWKPVLKI
jgi:hypothetical protein